MDSLLIPHFISLSISFCGLHKPQGKPVTLTNPHLYHCTDPSVAQTSYCLYQVCPLSQRSLSLPLASAEKEWGAEWQRGENKTEVWEQDIKINCGSHASRGALDDRSRNRSPEGVFRLVWEGSTAEPSSGHDESAVPEESPAEVAQG